MLGAIRKRLTRDLLRLGLAFSAICLFASCASKEPPPLVADPAESGRESTIPWNRQQKWEQGAIPGLPTEGR